MPGLAQLKGVQQNRAPAHGAHSSNPSQSRDGAWLPRPLPREPPSPSCSKCRRVRRGVAFRPREPRIRMTEQGAPHLRPALTGLREAGLDPRSHSLPVGHHRGGARWGHGEGETRDQLEGTISLFLFARGLAVYTTRQGICKLLEPASSTKLQDRGPHRPQLRAAHQHRTTAKCEDGTISNRTEQLMKDVGMNSPFVQDPCAENCKMRTKKIQGDLNTYQDPFPRPRTGGVDVVREETSSQTDLDPTIQATFWLSLFCRKPQADLKTNKKCCLDFFFFF